MESNRKKEKIIQLSKEKSNKKLIKNKSINNIHIKLDKNLFNINSITNVNNITNISSKNNNTNNISNNIGHSFISKN
jgi:hypothetical protein